MSVFVSAGLISAPGTPCVDKMIAVETDYETAKTLGSFTSLQVVHTHASLPRGWFFSSGHCDGALILALRQDATGCAQSKYRAEDYC